MIVRMRESRLSPGFFTTPRIKVRLGSRGFFVPAWQSGSRPVWLSLCPRDRAKRACPGDDELILGDLSPAARWFEADAVVRSAWGRLAGPVPTLGSGRAELGAQPTIRAWVGRSRADRSWVGRCCTGGYCAGR